MSLERHRLFLSGMLKKWLLFGQPTLEMIAKGAEQMPELPEMEIYRAQCQEHVSGKQITAVEVTREKTINVPVETFIKAVKDRTIVRVDRRGKMLLFRLDSGSTLLLHLMLDGSMFYGTEAEKLERTAQAVLHFGEQRLFFHGLRLGYLHLFSDTELNEKLGKLGPEPTDPAFSAEAFGEQLRLRPRSILKTALTNQQVIAGIGNCYCDEMCFQAAVQPLRKISDLADAELFKLYTAMKSTLFEAVRYGGYMETPFTAEDRFTGGYNDRCKVYDRGGEPCFRCGEPIIRAEHHRRKVFYCGRCQR